MIIEEKAKWVSQAKALGNELDAILAGVDRLRDAGGGTAIEALGITGLAEHVLTARDDCATRST